MFLWNFNPFWPTVKVLRLRLFAVGNVVALTNGWGVDLIRGQNQLLLVIAIFVLGLREHLLLRSHVFASVLQVLGWNVNDISLGFCVDHGYFWLFAWHCRRLQDGRCWRYFLDFFVDLAQLDVCDSQFVGRCSLGDRAKLGGLDVVNTRRYNHWLFLWFGTCWALGETRLLVETNLDWSGSVFRFLVFVKSLFQSGIDLWKLWGQVCRV